MRGLIRVDAPRVIGKNERKAFERFGFSVRGKAVFGFPEDFDEFSEKAPVSLVAQEITGKYRSADYLFSPN